MKDSFALLGQQRRPWLDLAELTAAYDQLSASRHPDLHRNLPEAARKQAEEQYSEINRAFQLLASPKDRLRHFLELERGARLGDLQEVSPDLLTLFMDLHNEMQELGRFLRERDATVSPLLKVQQLAAAQAWITRLQKRKPPLECRKDALLREVETLNGSWAGAQAQERPELLKRAEAIYHELGFVERWLRQLNEASLRLMI